MPVINRPGGGGAVNLAYMQTQKGKGDLISVYSPPILLTHLTGLTQYSYKDTTPIARLITDYAAFVVPENSKYHSIKEVMDALKKILNRSKSVALQPRVQWITFNSYW